VAPSRDINGSLAPGWSVTAAYGILTEMERVSVTVEGTGVTVETDLDVAGGVSNSRKNVRMRSLDLV